MLNNGNSGMVSFFLSSALLSLQRWCAVGAVSERTNERTNERTSMLFVRSFVHFVRSFTSFVRSFTSFVRSLRSFTSLVRFVGSLRSLRSLRSFVHCVRWFVGSLVRWFVGSFVCRPFSLSLLCSLSLSFPLLPSHLVALSLSLKWWVGCCACSRGCYPAVGEWWWW